MLFFRITDGDSAFADTTERIVRQKDLFLLQSFFQQLSLLKESFFTFFLFNAFDDAFHIRIDGREVTFNYVLQIGLQCVHDFLDSLV